MGLKAVVPLWLYVCYSVHGSSYREMKGFILPSIEFLQGRRPLSHDGFPFALLFMGVATVR